MSDAGSVGDRELDKLIAEITVDAYDEDEQLMGFENAFDEEVASRFRALLSARMSRACQWDAATGAAS